MNEQAPATTPGVDATSPPAYRDRSTGLVVFGILTILLGCLSGLFVLLLLGQMAAVKVPNHPAVNVAAMLPAVAIYGGLAVGLIWLGIGSIQARRWARALLLIFSWSWLVIGIFMLVAMTFILPKTLGGLSANPAAGQPPLPAAAVNGIIVGMLLVFGVMFVLLPAVWTFFYRSRHVKATCEARDPVTRWTDGCPLPVLGFCLWLLLAVPMMLLMPVTGHGVMPFFGMFLSGVPGALVCLLVAGVWAGAAWLLYRLDPRGWWLILIAMMVFLASALLTYAHHDFVEMYRLMGYSQAQIDQIQKTGLLTGNRMSWLTAFSMVPFLGYLLFIKRFLRPTSIS
jgi:hypothetical protein